MTWSEALIGSIVLIVLWSMGIVMLQFPGGMYAVWLRKMAQLWLRYVEKWESLFLNWGHSHITGARAKITYYEWMQYMAQDPEKAIHTYTPWAIPIFRLAALLWLVATFWFTVSFLQILTQGG